MKVILNSGMLLFFLLFAISCDRSDEHPSEIMEKEVFVNFLADLQIVQSTEQFIRNRDLNFDVDSSYKWLLKEYDITEQDFDTTLYYYSRDPEVFEELYDQVIVVITEKQVELTKKPED